MHLFENGGNKRHETFDKGRQEEKVQFEKMQKRIVELEKYQEMANTVGDVEKLLGDSQNDYADMKKKYEQSQEEISRLKESFAPLTVGMDDDKRSLQYQLEKETHLREISEKNFNELKEKANSLEEGVKFWKDRSDQAEFDQSRTPDPLFYEAKRFQEKEEEAEKFKAEYEKKLNVVEQGFKAILLEKDQEIEMLDREAHEMKEMYFAKVKSLKAECESELEKERMSQEDIFSQMYIAFEENKSKIQVKQKSILILPVYIPVYCKYQSIISSFWRRSAAPSCVCPVIFRLHPPY